MNKPRILLLSAYDAISHQLWRKRLKSLFPEYEWQQLCLPPRHFTWRVRGNSLIWATTQREVLEQNYDLLIATSMVDLSSLRGFVPSLASIPTLLYVHENQFEYPQNRSDRKNVEPMLVPLYAALCADTVAFNSDFNRNSFLKGAASLLSKLPEQFPSSIMTQLNASIVLAVPLPENSYRSPAPGTDEVLSVVWNHRWEFDKGPQLLLAITAAIEAKKLPIQLHVVGQQFREQPIEFEQINSLLDRHAKETGITRGLFGFVEEHGTYLQLLKTCDAVLSTANHDFQGLAVQEACLMGCVPLTPDDLAYPEYIAEKYRYSVRNSIEATADGALKQLLRYCKLKSSGELVCDVDLSAYQGD
ncbi:MAG: glycosyltransferase involved in cell wall biosynthesis, partial [Pseudohongiellaceae bacterium]